MPLDNVVQPSNEQRIRDLENQVADLARLIRVSRAPIVSPGDIRLAEVTDATGDDVVGVKWIRQTHDGTDVTLTDRSASTQSDVGVVDAATLAEGARSYAVRINGQWFFISGYAGKLIVVKAPVNGIPARDGSTPGSAICTVLKLDDNGDLITTTRTETVYNFVSLDIMVDGERLGLANQDEFGAYWAVAEDCHDGQPV